MDNKYMTEGYSLMIQYLKEQRILTKQRNFRRRLDNFYKQHKDQETLTLEDEKEYLQLEKYFFNNILEQRNNKDKAYVQFLNIIADAPNSTEENKTLKK